MWLTVYSRDNGDMSKKKEVWSIYGKNKFYLYTVKRSLQVYGYFK